MNDRSSRSLALYGALLATFAETHPFCDHIVQNSDDAKNKGKPGREGRAACARHVATYTCGQTITAAAVTLALGYRLPARAWLAGTLINAATHYAIDRREPFKQILRRAGLGEDLDRCTVQRRPGVVDDAGPGTAFMELDQAAHRLIGVAAATVTTCLAVRAGTL